MSEATFFNLHDLSQGLPRELAEGITTRIFAGDMSMLSVARLEPHASGTLHAHPEEQWGVLLEGTLIRVQDGVEVEAKAGDFWRTPGGAAHTVRAGASGALVLDIFAPPRKIYLSPGAGFGTPESA